MTPLRTLTLLVLLTFILCLGLFLFKQYIGFVASLILLALAGFFWHRMLIEELIIHFVYSHSFRTQYDRILEMFGEKRRPDLERLIKKKVLDRSGDEVRLIKKQYRFTVSKQWYRL